MAASISARINSNPCIRFPTFFKKMSDKHGVSFRFVKASMNHQHRHHQLRLMESDKLGWEVRKRAMEAVESCGNRVTIGDVASRAGLNLSEAQKALQALAADTHGFLEVTDEGDILYVFPKDYYSILTAKSLKIKFESVVLRAKNVAEKLVRVSFGTALIASIGIVSAAILCLTFFEGADLGDLSFGGISNIQIDTYRYNSYSSNRGNGHKIGVKMNFIDSVFSFVFGDGDPNHGIEEERWKLIGRYIVSNGGVVTAEQLAPYLDLETRNGDESYFLPILLRFDGQPEIDEKGNIFYRFPALQRTASSQDSRWADCVGGVEKFLVEKTWEFRFFILFYALMSYYIFLTHVSIYSKTSARGRVMVFGYGTANLFLVSVLGLLLNATACLPNKFIQFVSLIFPLLLIYATSFFIIPLVRRLLISWKNAQIMKRNYAREQRAIALKYPDLSLRHKLMSVREMAQRTVISQDQVIYSTEKDLLDQDYETKDWDEILKKIEQSNCD